MSSMELRLKNINNLLQDNYDVIPDDTVDINVMKRDIIETIECLISYYTIDVVRDVIINDIYSYPTDVVTDIILSYNQLMDYYNDNQLISNIFNQYLQ